MKKLILSILIAGVSFGYSLADYEITTAIRNPKEISNPYDYYLQGVLNGRYGKLKLGYERDSGKFYRMYYLKSNETKSKYITLDKISIELNYDEEDNINQQWLYKTLDNIEKDNYTFKTRISANWQEWENARPMIGMAYTFKKLLVIQYDTSLNRNILRTSLNYDINDNQKIQYKYNVYDYKQPDWQFKLIIKG